MEHACLLHSLQRIPPFLLWNAKGSAETQVTDIRKWVIQGWNIFKNLSDFWTVPWYWAPWLSIWRQKRKFLSFGEAMAWFRRVIMCAYVLWQTFVLITAGVIHDLWFHNQYFLGKCINFITIAKCRNIPILYTYHMITSDLLQVNTWCLCLTSSQNSYFFVK